MGERVKGKEDEHPGRRGSPEVPPYPNSLCHRCAARRYVKGRVTLFVLCTAMPEKYPPQPVIRCESFRPIP